MTFIYLIKTRICDKACLNEVPKNNIKSYYIYIYIEYAISTKKSYFVKLILNLIIQKYYTNLK